MEVFSNILSNMWIIWIIAAIVFACIEIATPSFYIIWFSCGSIAACITSLFTKNVTIQFVIFLLISIICMLSTKKFADKVLSSRKAYKSNVDRFINSKGIVTETIIPIENKGRIKINGESWKATSSDIIENGNEVLVESVDGVTLKVKKI